MSVPVPAGAPPRWIRRFDWALLLALLVIAAVELTDGFGTRIGGFRLSVRSTARLMYWFVALLVVRHVWWRRHSLLDHLAARGWLVRDDAIGEGVRVKRWEVVQVFLFFTAIVAVLLHEQVLAPLSVPDHGDPLFSTWRLAWVGRTLFTNPLQLFDANIFHPEPGTLAYSDSIIVPSVLASPLFLIGVPRLAVYNLLLLGAFIASGVTMYFLVSRVTGSRASGLLSGTIFAVYPYRFEHYSHLELQMTVWMPLALLVLHRLVKQGTWRRGLLLGVVLALQALSSLYYGIYFSLYLAVVFVALVALSRARPLLPKFQALVVAGLVTAAALAPVALPYLQNRERVGERGEAENVYYSAMPGDYLMAHPRSALYGDLLPIGPPERCLFPGVTPVVLAAVALVPPLNTVRAAYGLALFLAFDASLGFNAELYPALYRRLVPLHGLRVPARFSILVGMTLAILAGLALARARPRFPRAGQVALAAIAILLVLVEYRPVLGLRPAWADMPSVYEPLVGHRPASVIAVFPMAPEMSDTDAKYMYFSTWHWQRMVNGYSGNFPRSYGQLTAWMRSFPEREAIDYLQQRGVEFIVLHGEFARPEEQDRFAAALDAEPRLALVGVFPAQPRPSRLYRFRSHERAATPAR